MPSRLSRSHNSKQHKNLVLVNFVRDYILWIIRRKIRRREISIKNIPSLNRKQRDEGDIPPLSSSLLIHSVTY